MLNLEELELSSFPKIYSLWGARVNKPFTVFIIQVSGWELNVQLYLETSTTQSLNTMKEKDVFKMF